MKKFGDYDFGVIIAFLLPGFIFLWALLLSFPGVTPWLLTSSATTPQTNLSVGGFLYSALASLALGLILSALRWRVIDWLLNLMGVKCPELDFSKLKDHDTAAAFRDIVENHYRYYQYYANTLVAIVAGCLLYRFSGHSAQCLIYGAALIVVIVLFVGGKDALEKYYKRAGQILPLAKEEAKHDQRVS